MTAIRARFVRELSFVTALALLLAPAVRADGTSGSFAVNGKKFSIAHAYAYDFPFKFPSEDGNPPEALRVLALSDKPFDTAMLDRVCQPDVDIDLRGQRGAVVLNVLYSAGSGAARMIKYRAPGMDSFANTGPETDGTKFTLDATNDGSVRGRLAMAGDAKMHEFDPANVPLVTADVAFSAKPPVSRVITGAALPAGGGDPGKTYLAFNAAIGGKDPKAPLGFLRAPLREAVEAVPAEANNPFAEIKITSPNVESGVSDGERARILVSGKAVDDSERSSQVCMMKEGGKWLIDGFLPED